MITHQRTTGAVTASQTAFAETRPQLEIVPRTDILRTHREVKRARRGTGSIFKQAGCATWTIQYYKRGKRIRESTGFTDYRAAQQRLTQQLHRINTGEYTERQRKPVLVAELYEPLERHYRINKRKSLDAIRRRWKHLQKFFADMPAVNVSYELLEQYNDIRLEEGAANATCNRELACLKTAFRIGYRNGQLTHLPLFPHLEENNVRTGFIEDEHYERLRSEATELWLRLYMELDYTYGWRKQELLGLRVRQVVLRSRTIRLDVGSTKNGDGREVTMTSTVVKLMRQAIEGKGPEDFVLTRSDGKPIKDFRKAWRNTCVRAHLGSFVCRDCERTVTARKCECGSRRLRYRGLFVHDFRRSAARALRRAGVPESVVMKIGGWKTADMFRRYAIVSQADIAAGVDKLEQHRCESLRTQKGENSHDFSHDLGLSGSEGAESVHAGSH